MSHHGSHIDRQQAHFERERFQLARFLIKNPRFPRTMRKKIGYVADAFAGCERLLEVGTGRGLQLAQLLERLDGGGTAYTGVDLAVAPLAEARAAVRPSHASPVFFAAAIVESLPFPDATFDGVFCIDVLHHAASQVEMLAEIRRVLRPGGRVICIEPNPIFPVNVIFLRDPIERGMFALSRRRAREWLTAAGLAEPSLMNLPIFFPSFPASLARVYDRVERVLARVPLLRRVSTTCVLSARRPER